MAVDRESSLIEEVYACDVCSASAYGFTRPSEGRPYYKFPPTIGATGQASILFVGINPRRSQSNAQLHREAMANLHSFEMLAANKRPYHGRPSGKYIRSSGVERHYGLHVKLVEAVFGSGARFEDYAAVTELFLCASEDSTGVQRAVAQNLFPCADRYFAQVLAQAKPLVVVAVGAPPARYLRRQQISHGPDSYCIRLGGHEAAVVELPHPNARVSTPEREAAFHRATQEIRRLRSESSPRHSGAKGAAPPAPPEVPKPTRAGNAPKERPGGSQTTTPPEDLAPAGPREARSRADQVSPEEFTVLTPRTGKLREGTTESVANQPLRVPLREESGPPPPYLVPQAVFRLAGIFAWALGFWIMNRSLNAVLVGLLLWWAWAGVVAVCTAAIRRAHITRYIRRTGQWHLTDASPSDHYRAWHSRPHGGDPDESNYDTFVAYPIESHARVAVQLLQYRPTILFTNWRVKGLKGKRGNPATVESKARGFVVKVIEQRSLPSDADTAEAAELKAAMDERAARDEADARLRWQSQRQRHGETELTEEDVKDQAAEAQSTVEAIKHWPH